MLTGTGSTRLDPTLELVYIAAGDAVSVADVVISAIVHL